MAGSRAFFEGSESVCGGGNGLQRRVLPSLARWLRRREEEGSADWQGRWHILSGTGCIVVQTFITLKVRNIRIRRVRVAEVGGTVANHVVRLLLRRAVQVVPVHLQHATHTFKFHVLMPFVFSREIKQFQCLKVRCCVWRSRVQLFFCIIKWSYI
jgi:hypothetical protein